MLSTEQLAARKVGGSDVGTILGLNPYKTALELYAEIKEQIPRDDFSENLAVEAGELLEDGIATLTERHMTRRLGRPIKLRRCNLTLSNPKYPWLTAHIDRDVVGEERGVEIKNVGWRMGKFWGEEDTDQIPEYYLPQPHTYMLVKDYPAWTVSGYFGGADLRLYEVERDKEFAEIIIEETHNFWHHHVLKGVPPAFDPGHAAASRALKRIYPGTDGSTLTADKQIEHWRAVMEEADALEARYKKSGELAKLHILSAMGEAAVMKFADGSSMTRKQVTRKGYTVDATTYVDARIKKPTKE
jgi:putative phage-type endonuclease